MAQTATRKLWASGKLTTIDNSSLSSLEQTFENKMKKGKKTIEKNALGSSYMNLLTTMIVRVRPMIWVPGQWVIC